LVDRDLAKERRSANPGRHVEGLVEGRVRGEEVVEREDALLAVVGTDARQDEQVVGGAAADERSVADRGLPRGRADERLLGQVRRRASRQLVMAKLRAAMGERRPGSAVLGDAV